MRKWIAVFVMGVVSMVANCGELAPDPKMVQESTTGIKHSFAVFGAETFIVMNDGTIPWTYPGATRDGWVMPDGILMAVSHCKEHPGGAIVFMKTIGHKNEKVVIYEGTQSEVHSVQGVAGKPDAGNNVVLTEGGPKPRLLEVNRDGKIEVEFALKCQIPNAHMQTRMARKLPNGNYIVPHLLDHVVREYKADGTVVNEIKTPDEPKDSWPFTAIRLENGNTLITCTHGNLVIEVDKDGKIVWQLTNKDLPTPLLKDPCGAQRLANGNTVIASYGASGQDDVKMLEVTPEKKVVWIFKSGKKGGVHEFHIFGEGNEMVK